MLKTKVYETYYPYKNGGKGIEYCFNNTEEEVIDYNNYYHSSFDLFWSNLEARFDLYKLYINGSASMPCTKESFQNALIDIYAERYIEKETIPYYYYIDINTQEFREKIIPGDNVILKFLIDQNQYLKEERSNNGSISYTIDSYTVNDDQYKNVYFYIGVDIFNDLNEENTISLNSDETLTVEQIKSQSIKMFHYYEFNKKIKKIQHKIITLRIDAPIGTSFYLNHMLHPIEVYKYTNPFILDNLKGYYEIQPEDYVTLKYLTFPKDAIPKYQKVLNESYDPNDPNSERTRDANFANDFYLTVSYLYDDDYDIEYEEE